MNHQFDKEFKHSFLFNLSHYWQRLPTALDKILNICYTAKFITIFKLSAG